MRAFIKKQNLKKTQKDYLQCKKKDFLKIKIIAFLL